MNRTATSSRDSILRGGNATADQFRAIAEIRGEVAWVVDCATLLPSYISPSVETVLGYTPEDFHNQLSGASAGGPLAELCGGLRERLRRFAQGDRSRIKLTREFDQEHGDGRVVPIEVVSTLLLDADGAAHSLVGMLRDVGPQRDYEDAQRRFASMLNHEFRTPLSTIDGAIQRLEVVHANADEATRLRYRKIGAAVDRLIGMLDDYLSPDRLESIGGKRRPDSVEPRRLLDEGAEIARAAGRSVSVDAANLPAEIRCAPDGLRLAIKVLVENALQYSAQGSTIAISGRRADGGIEMLVRDQGEGVPQGETVKIFEKFYRGSNAGDRPGSGLGLYMARSVVDVHGGSLSVRNLDVGGAEFRLWLPSVDRTGKKVAPSGPSSDNPEQIPRVSAGLRAKGV
jgi:PAS domain S-box-containing protein